MRDELSLVRSRAQFSKSDVKAKGLDNQFSFNSRANQNTHHKVLDLIQRQKANNYLIKGIMRESFEQGRASDGLTFSKGVSP